MQIDRKGKILLDNPDKWWEEIHPWNPEDPSYGHYFQVVKEDGWLYKNAYVCMHPDYMLDNLGDQKVNILMWSKVKGYHARGGQYGIDGLWWISKSSIRYVGPEPEDTPYVWSDNTGPYERFIQIAGEKR